MHKPTIVLLGALCLAGGAALAKLPAPTPEEEAVKAASKAKQEEQLKKEQQALERAQDRVVQQYRKNNKGANASSGSGQQTQPDQMPKTTSEPDRSVGPKPDRPASAEAHSAPAK